MSELAERASSNGLLPGLPDDLALLCLARLSLRTLALCQCVSRALRDCLHPLNTSFQAIRLQLGIRNEFCCLFLAIGGIDEEWRFVDEDVDWLLLDPLHHRCEILPSPVPPSSSDYEMLPQSLQAMHAHGKVLLNGMNFYTGEPAVMIHDALGFDVLERRWYFDHVQPTTQNDRVEFAWANMDDYLYVAGGRSIELYSPPYNSAERFDFVTQRWETLPDMKEAREVCSGFVMDGCFYVIGGLQEGDCSNSAEFFDPKTNCWTLVPQMWPAEMAATNWVLEAPTVAVVKQELYALKYKSREILWYEKLQNKWVGLGDFPESSCREMEIGW